MKLRVANKRCDQCLFSSAKIVDDERKEDVLKTCEETDTHFVCHKFTIADGEESSVCCRAFFDRDREASTFMQIATRLGWVEFVDLPEEP